MRRRLFLLLAVLLGTAAVPSASAEAASVLKAPSAPAPVAPPKPDPTEAQLASIASRVGVTAQTLRAKWQRVAQCEVDGNWSMVGPYYSGIGFLNSTWYEYGGGRFAPKAGGASRDQQIIVGMDVTGGWIPDQYGCSSGGW